MTGFIIKNDGKLLYTNVDSPNHSFQHLLSNRQKWEHIEKLDDGDRYELVDDIVNSEDTEDGWIRAMVYTFKSLFSGDHVELTDVYDVMFDTGIVVLGMSALVVMEEVNNDAIYVALFKDLYNEDYHTLLYNDVVHDEYYMPVASRELMHRYVKLITPHMKEGYINHIMSVAASNIRHIDSMKSNPGAPIAMDSFVFLNTHADKIEDLHEEIIESMSDIEGQPEVVNNLINSIMDKILLFRNNKVKKSYESRNNN